MPCASHSHKQIFEALDYRLAGLLSNFGTIKDKTKPEDMKRASEAPLTDAFIRSEFSPCDNQIISAGDVMKIRHHISATFKRAENILDNDSIEQRFYRTGLDMISRSANNIRYAVTDVIQGGADFNMAPLDWSSSNLARTNHR